MTSGIATIERYRLHSVFDGDTVVHTTHKSDVQSGQRKVEVKTRWGRETVLGSGVFGVVWREREETSGELRAVKVISKLQFNIQETQVFADVQDVSLLPSSPYSRH